jgi:arginine/lysine/ornithine decarboxylase
MDAYLDEMLVNYSRGENYPFHMPGHKRQQMGDWIPEEIDITEIDGFDNLHHAEGILKEAQERMANTFGADHSFFLVNGSTAGILAAISGSVKKGDRILIGRNSHKAVYHAAYLMELRTEYVYPAPTDFGIQGSIEPEAVKEKLREFPDIAAVVITSPTYDGVVSDIASIAKIVHSHGIPLIVDEAHGAHFGFSDGFPQKALRLGADLCVESLHKTLPSYTQTAVLHVADSEWVDLARVQRYLGIYQTSSPSYVLMAGMDRCTRILLKSGGELFDAFEKRLQRFYQACENLQWVSVFSHVGADFGIWDKDRSKILICAEKAGYNGQELYDLLLNQYHLQMEMASGHYVTALTSIMDTDAGFERLWKALSDIDGAKKTASGQQNILTPEGMYRPVGKKMEIYQAMDAPKQKVELMKSAEMVSAEFIYLYPPGIPMAAPGEVISEEMLQILAVCQQRGMQVQGMEDTQGKYLFTIV